SDAEGQGEERDRGEAGIPAQGAQAIPEVAAKSVEPAPRDGLAEHRGRWVDRPLEPAQLVAESVARGQLVEDHAPSLRVRGAESHQLAEAILEVLGQLFDDLLDSHGVEVEVRQAAPHLRPPITHTRLP